MEIQRLDLHEAVRLRAIRLRALREAPHAFATTYEESLARPMEVWSKQLAELATFVAVHDGADVGLARVGPDGNAGDAMLLSMWVAPEVRGTGLGEALIDAAVEWARAQRFARLVLEVKDDNTHAVALYSRKGFELTADAGARPHVREHRRALTLR
jgi:ribosomal protein S18 acetylase RimI-like enzyme